MNGGNHIKIAFLLTLFTFMACSDDSDSSNPTQPPLALETETNQQFPDLIVVHAENMSALLGTSEATAKANERPQMEVTFTYTFSMGKHEVTCGEFNTLMRESLGKDFNKIECKNDSLPVANVSYYDAILYANARSKKENTDSVYSYTEATFDKDGHCTYLDGIVFNPDKDGFRLPTEAEWTLAASQNSTIENSWNASNSNFEAHKICTKGVNKIGFCDLAGNVMEWANDWLGNFKDTAIVNYVGSPDGGSLGERIVKGGSFRSEYDAINTTSRGDVYTVTSSTRANYVGFRLAFGKIPNATWLSNNGNASSSRLISLASSSVLKKWTGTYKAKLAFRNDITENIVFLDYSSGTQSFVEIRDSIPSFHPEISPDGKKVAFCTKPEGVSGKSELYVRDLNADGSNLTKLNAESAAIPRWKVLDSGDTVIHYVSTAQSNKDDATFNSSSTWQVSFSHGKFGTPKKLLDGAYHGGISDDNKLAVSGAQLLRTKIAVDQDIFQSSAKDSIWYNKEQACNVSLSKDNSKRTLFLDFAGKTGKDFVGSSYSTHERMLIADSTGKLTQSILAPKKYTFDHSEWASGNLVIATLTNLNGSHEKIVLVNIEDSSSIELISGEELWHPNLWIGETHSYNTNLDLDSAGIYYSPSGSEAAVMLRNKMEIMWNYRDSRLAILGSSRSLNGLDATALQDSLLAINLSNIPNSLFVSDYIFSNYLLKHLDKLKYIVLSLDIDMWWKQENNSEDNFFYSAYRQYPGYVYDENHNFWEDGYPEGIAEATHESYNIDYFADIFGPTRGSHSEPEGSWEKDPTVDYDSTWYDRHPEYYNANLSKLESMIEKAHNRGITVIGIIFPMSPSYKKTGSFGRYGFRRSQAPKLIGEIELLSEKYPNFILMDENKMGDHDYTDEMANNRDHLSVKGSARITGKLDSLILTLD